MDLDGFCAGLGEIAASTDPATLRRKSRDFFWYSPVLKRQLENCTGDVVVQPRDERELLQVATLARRFEVELSSTWRASTGSFPSRMVWRASRLG